MHKDLGKGLPMSTHTKESHYENHQSGAELHDNTAHIHQVAAEHRGEQDHPTGAESSRHAREHSEASYVQELHQTPTTEHGFITFGHEDIARLAYELWEARGCPEGSAEEDWSRAVAQLRARKVNH